MESKVPQDDATQYRSGMSAAEYAARFGGAPDAKLGSNENAYGVSPRVAEAIHAQADLMHRYPPMQDEGLRAALSGYWGSELSVDHFVTGNGAVDVLSLVAQWKLREGTSCVVCRPTFPVYEWLAKRQGATAHFADLKTPDFSYDIDAMLAAVTADTRLMFLCSPNNPTGTACPPEEIWRLAKALPDHVLLVLDEVYHHFATHRRTSFEILKSNVILVHSFSKAFGLAGARLGYGIARPEIAREIAKYRLPFHINSATVAAGLAALEDTDHVERTVSSLIKGRTWLTEQLRVFDMDIWPSEANFILCRPRIPAEAVYEGLLERGIIVRPLAGFYLPDCFRVSVGTPEENERLVTALRAVLTDWRRRV